MIFGGTCCVSRNLVPRPAWSNAARKSRWPWSLGKTALRQFLRPKSKGRRARAEQFSYTRLSRSCATRLALRESAADGLYLVFPSSIHRDYRTRPSQGKGARSDFRRPVQSLYSTLACGLSHRSLHPAARDWRNERSAQRSLGKCGLYLHAFAEAAAGW